MSALSIPSRASDAGPESSDSRMDYDDWLFEARWQAKAAERIERPDPKVQYKLRMEAIEAAMDALKNARRLLGGE